MKKYYKIIPGRKSGFIDTPAVLMPRELPKNWTVKPMPSFPSPNPPRGFFWDGANWRKGSKRGKGPGQKPKPSRRKTGMGAGRSGGRQSLYGAADLRKAVEKMVESNHLVPKEAVAAVMAEIKLLPKADQDLLKEAKVAFGVHPTFAEGGQYVFKTNTLQYADGVLYDLVKASAKSKAEAAATIRHEIGHAVDHLRAEKLKGSPGFAMNPNVQKNKMAGRTTIALASRDFKEAVIKDLQAARKNPEARAFLEKEAYYTAPTGVRKTIGGNRGDWVEKDGSFKTKRSLRLEMWAETYSRVNGPKSAERTAWETHFPKTVKAMRAILEQ